MKQTGQRCTATSRVYIEEAIYEEVLQRLTEEAKKNRGWRNNGSCILKGAI